MKNNQIEWNCIKIPFALGWSLIFYYALWNSSFIAIERGVCTYFNCDLLVHLEVKVFISLLTLLLLILYILEKWILLTTAILALLSYFVFSLHESFGVQARTGLLPLIFLVQTFAYYQFRHNNSSNLAKNRINYSIQVIVACYTLAGISKLRTSGFDWFLDAKNIALQVLKSNQMTKLDGFSTVNSEQISYRISFIAEHPNLISIFLLFALLMELLSGLALVNKQYRLVIGTLLLIMHIGIFVSMEIIIFPFVLCLVLFLINPYYLFYSYIKKHSRKTCLKD